MITKNYRAPLLYCVFFTLISLFIHRYAYGIGDQAIHIPLIYKLLDHNLFPTDPLFIAGQSNLSLFYKFIAYIISAFKIDIETFFATGFFIGSYFFYLGLYHLSKLFFKVNYWAAFFLGLFFLVPIQIAGTATYSVETSFVPRFITYILSLWVIYFIYTRKYFLSAILLSLVFAIHPLSFLYLAIILFFLNSYNRNRLLSFSFLIFFIFSFLILNFSILNYFFQKSQLLVFDSSNSIWLNILRERNPYAFLDLWGGKGWLSLAIIVLPSIYYIYFYKSSSDKIKKFIKSITIACLSAALIQYTFTSIYPTPFIIQLQLGRIWIYSYFSSSIAIVSIFLSSKLNLRVMSSLIIIIFLLWSVFYHKKWYYIQNVSWIKVQKWISENTHKSCIFLIPFDHQGFRVYAKRAVVSEYKDGTLSFYSPVFAFEWSERTNDMEKWDGLVIDDLIKLQDKYHFSYLVTSSEKDILQEAVYNDGQYMVYKMPTVEKECD